jgi:L-2-hydroxycarboxylate dehydrogenase (NAD+)
MKPVARIEIEALTDYAEQVLRSIGVPATDAAIIAAHLVEADARGVHSHGTDLLPAYWRGFAGGHLNPQARIQVVHQTGAVAVIDGDNGLGHLVSDRAVGVAVEMAKESGIGAVAVRNSNHFGMGGSWPLKMLRAGLIGFATTNGPSVMAPTGARVAGISNNPFSWGVPAGRETPILLDMALTVGALGRVRLAQQGNERLPEGWALDSTGRPTTDPELALQGVMLPVGGHKGSGVAVVNELLSATLSAASFLNQISNVTMASSGVHVRWSIGHFFLALDPGAFRQTDDFLDDVDAVIRTLKETPSAPGGKGVTLPGERGFRRAAEARRLGVSLPTASIEKLNVFEEFTGVSFPTAKAAAARGENG